MRGFLSTPGRHRVGFFFGLIMAYSTAERIIIKHLYTDGNLFEFHPTEVQLASGIALRVALEDATKRGVSLGSANLRCANLGSANLDGAYLRGADLRGADLAGANLRGADLRGANLRGANLDGAKLNGAKLDGANLRGASLDGANLRGANLGGANLVGDRPIFIIGPIGSRCDYFTAYLTNKGIYLSAGCFFGSTADFTTNLANEHGESAHAKEYTAALLLIECHARLWTPANFETAPEAAEVK